jgi:hypothetical protein
MSGVGKKKTREESGTYSQDGRSVEKLGEMRIVEK